MIKRIPIKGMSSLPSNKVAPEGDMAEAINVYGVAGECVPVCRPEDVSGDFGIGDGWDRVICVHNGNAVLLRGGNIYGWSNRDTHDHPLFTGEGTFKSVSTMGNMLIISSDTAVYYCLWKDGAYSFMGSEIPTPDIALFGQPVESGRIDTSGHYDTVSDQTFYAKGLASFGNTGFSGSGEFFAPTTLNFDSWSQGLSHEVSASPETDQDDCDGTVVTYKVKEAGNFIGSDGKIRVTYLSPASILNRIWEELDVILASNNKNGFASFPYLLTIAVRLFGDERTYAKVSPPIYVDGFSKETNAATGFIRTKVTTGQYDATMEESGVLDSVKNFLRKMTGSEGRAGDTVYPMSVTAQLTDLYTICAVVKNAAKTFEGWEDIVAGVDFFISLPVNPHRFRNKLAMTPFGQADGNSTASSNSTSGSRTSSRGSGSRGPIRTGTEGTVTGSASSSGGIHDRPSSSTSTSTTQGGSDRGGDSSVRTDKTSWQERYYTGNGYSAYMLLDPDSFRAEPAKVVESCDTFFLLKSFTLEEFKALSDSADADGQTFYEFKENIGSDWLASQKSLPYSYQSCHVPVSFKAKTFNQRSLIYDISQKLSGGYRYVNGAKSEANSTGYQLCFHLRTGKGTSYVRGVLTSGQLATELTASPYAFISYPDSRCESVDILYDTDGGTVIKNYKMKVFGTRDAAYCFIGFTSGFTPDDEFGSAVSLLPSGSGMERVTDRVWQSEVDNPFHFPAAGRHAVGDGDVLGLATAATALSQGQFGAFNLYTFTDEGLWVLSVNGDGTFGTAQPLSRDVVSNPDSITEIDQAVVFTSERGLLLLQGARVTDLTPAMKGEHYGYDELLSGELKGTAWESTYGMASDRETFMHFLSGCDISYDYSGGRLVLMNAEKNYQYTYIFSTQSWQKVQPEELHIISGTNSFPRCLVNVKSGYGVKLYDISTPLDLSDPTLTPLPVAIVTRPMDLDAPDIFKTVRRIEVRGTCPKLKHSFLLLGSNDLRNWKMLHSLRGPSWRYFRIAVLATPLPKEAITYIEVDYEPRYNIRIR